MLPLSSRRADHGSPQEHRPGRSGARRHRCDCHRRAEPRPGTKRCRLAIAARQRNRAGAGVPPRRHIGAFDRDRGERQRLYLQYSADPGVPEPGARGCHPDHRALAVRALLHRRHHQAGGRLHRGFKRGARADRGTGAQRAGAAVPAGLLYNRTGSGRHLHAGRHRCADHRPLRRQAAVDPDAGPLGQRRRDPERPDRAVLQPGLRQPAIPAGGGLHQSAADRRLRAVLQAARRNRQQLRGGAGAGPGDPAAAVHRHGFDL